MSKRTAFLIAAVAVSLVVALLLPSFAARAIAAALLIAVTLFYLARAFRTSNTRSVGEDDRADGASDETFASAKLFEATMSGMREGLLVVDRDMRVIASNAAAHRLFNLSQGKLNAHRLTELTRNPAIYSAFLDGLNGKERSGVQIETHGPERSVFDLRVVPLSTNGSDTETSGALGVFIDVTRIERLEQVRQEFLSNVSHELRTPLTAIIAFVETLEAGAIDDKEATHRFLPIIRKNASRMNNLIDDILELSAIEAGNVQVKAEQVELYPIVTDVVSSLAAQAEAQGIDVLNSVPTPATVYADARRLEQMLTNLIENAIKFNRPGGQVEISYEEGSIANLSANEKRTTAGHSSVVSGPIDRIFVADTGEGIPAQHLERLFERFYRADRARSREMGGTGLGLAIVKHLARAHGGEVTVSSELGKGSTFTIELPRK